MVFRVKNWILAFLFITSGFSADKLALTMKTKGNVKIKVVETSVIQDLNRGMALSNGDIVITGEDGLAIILFLDDKTQLKIKGNSETEITGSIGKDGISKRVNMAFGSLKASIGKQKGEFVVSTPTSVASVKGTEFWLIVSPNPGDVLIGLSGNVEFTNTLTGQTVTVGAGMVVESTPDGGIVELVTIKISGAATSGIQGGSVSLSNVTLLDGDIGGGTLSGTVVISDITIFEGAAIEAGVIVTVTGVYDAETGNVSATLIDITEPITIEAVAASDVSTGMFSILDVVLVSGEAESVPTSVRITENTIITGGDVISGADVTVSGNYNEETGVIDASEILVVIPEIRISGNITSVSDQAIEVMNVVIMDGDVGAEAVSGVILITESTTVNGGELTVGLKVIVAGTFNVETGDITAQSITISRIIILATANSSVVNNQFEIIDISVLEGDFDPSNLSGIVIISPDTEIEGGDVSSGLQVTVTGSVEEGTGNFLATKVVVIVSERELLFELEDKQGKRMELIIKFQ